MAQFDCPVCDMGFDQKSRLERHMMTSHPKKAPSAADVEKALKGVSFPKSRDDLVENAKINSEDKRVIEILKKLDSRDYMDAADVARAIGALKSHEKKPSYQPSKRGGEKAKNTVSASSVAMGLKGIDFPKTGEEIKGHIRDFDGEVYEAIRDFPDDKMFNDMSEVEKHVGYLGKLKEK